MNLEDKLWLEDIRKSHQRNSAIQDTSTWEQTFLLRIITETQQENRRLKTELAARRPA